VAVDRCPTRRPTADGRGRSVPGRPAHGRAGTLSRQRQVRHPRWASPPRGRTGTNRRSRPPPAGRHPAIGRHPAPRAAPAAWTAATTAPSPASCSMSWALRARSPARLPTPIQAGSRWDVKRMHARMNGCGKLRCCTGRPSRDAARVRRRGAPRRGRARQNASQMLPRAGETVSPRAGLRSAHAGPAPAAMSIATADRTSPHPLTTTPAAPSHVPRHSLKGMTAVLLGRRERWRRWDAREAACPCSRRPADATGLVVSLTLL
jgi:hypothetical protein